MIAGKDDEGNSHLVELCSSLYVQLSRLCDRPATDYRGSSVLEGEELRYVLMRASMGWLLYASPAMRRAEANCNTRSQRSVRVGVLANRDGLPCNFADQSRFTSDNRR